MVTTLHKAIGVYVGCVCSRLTDVRAQKVKFSKLAREKGEEIGEWSTLQALPFTVYRYLTLQANLHLYINSRFFPKMAHQSGAKERSKHICGFCTCF